MERTDPSPGPSRGAAQWSGVLVAAVGASALAGWASGQPALMGVRADYVPMAPNTALAFVVTGAALAAFACGWRRPAGAAAAVVGAVALTRLAEFVAGADLAVDRWFFHVRGGHSGLAPTGKMSLPTSVAFLAACLGLIALTGPSWRAGWGHAAGACGLVTSVAGLVFSLGYLFSPNSPLLYGTESIPMALNTALCFVALGAGVVAAAGPGAFPLAALSGPSIRPRLLRTFLPLVVATVGLVAWLTHVVTASVGASSAAVSSAALATAAILTFGVICGRVAGRVGGQLEAAERALQEANDRLEARIDERTRELSRANRELAEALAQSRTAHESLLRAHAGLKEAQSRMLQQARMASLGQTAAGVAHEINNPLAFVTNNLAVLQREIAGVHDVLMLYQEAEQTLVEYRRDLYTRISDLSDEVDLPYVLDNLDGLLDRSRRGLLRIQRIVADLRDFAHLEEAEFQDADLNGGVVTTLRLMENLAAARQVALEPRLTPVPPLACSPAKINLVVQSLISNAIDACSPGGKVVVESRETGGDVEIAVTDDGCGIPPAVREKVFDPFFTTKPVGQGTGLGLAISYGIVKDHGGRIDFEPAPGRGTRFTVRLPLSPPGGIPAHPDGRGGAREPLAPV